MEFRTGSERVQLSEVEFGGKGEVSLRFFPRKRRFYRVRTESRQKEARLVEERGASNFKTRVARQLRLHPPATMTTATTSSSGSSGSSISSSSSRSAGAGFFLASAGAAVARRFLAGLPRVDEPWSAKNARRQATATGPVSLLATEACFLVQMY